LFLGPVFLARATVPLATNGKLKGVPLPAIAPMQPTLIAKPFHREGWVYEEKVDGYRMVAYKDGDRVQLISRQGKDHTRRFPELADAIRALRVRTVVLDGEVAVYDEQLTSRFEWIRQRPRDSVATPPLFMAFNCLQLDEGDLRSQALRIRRERLEYVLDRATAVLLPVRRLSDDGEAAPSGSVLLRCPTSSRVPCGRSADGFRGIRDEIPGPRRVARERGRLYSGQVRIRRADAPTRFGSRESEVQILSPRPFPAATTAVPAAPA
jgi:hypothetical protein